MDIKEISYLLAYAGMISSLVPFFSALYKFNSRTFYLKLLLVLSGVSFLCDALRPLTRGNTVLNAYRLFEFLILLLVFYRFFRQPGWRKAFIILAVAFVLFFGWNIFYAQENSLNTYTTVFSCLTFIVLSVIFFYRLMLDLPAEKLHNMPMFWIVVGTLFYFSGNLFLFMVYDYLMRENDMTKLFIYYDIHNSFNIIKNVLFTIALWQQIPISRSR